MSSNCILNMLCLYKKIKIKEKKLSHSVGGELIPRRTEMMPLRVLQSGAVCEQPQFRAGEQSLGMLMRLSFSPILAISFIFFYLQTETRKICTVTLSANVAIDDLCQIYWLRWDIEIIHNCIFHIVLTSYNHRYLHCLNSVLS